jgi:protein involved in polysaccharide export with SLBB domain
MVKTVVKIMKQNQLLKFRNLKTTILYVCTLYGFTAISTAQWSSDTKRDLLDSKSDLKGIIQAPVTNAPALDGPVDPDKYFIGPSDVISVNIWVSPPMNYSLTVTPEGTLIVPTVGEIRVADLTLSEGKKKIISEIKKKYLSGDPSVTLLKPRQVVVTIVGAVRFPGTYILDATERVDHAIAEANKPKKVEAIEIADERFKEKQSKRNIFLMRRTGEQSRVDIPRYYVARDDRWNPFLREGDKIVVPSTDPEKYVFAVYGAVNVQGSFEFVQGDSLLDAIELAYGYTPRAMRDSVVLYRYNFQTGRQDLSYFKYNEIEHGSLKNPVLAIGDRIIIKEQPDIRENYRVFVDGEVNYPGTFPITKDSTKLTNVLQWAGGFTEYASLSAAQIYRGTITQRESEIERLLSMRGSVMPEDSAYYLLESELRSKREVVNVNFKKLIFDKDSSQDIYLRSGDYISVPSIQRTIYVFGQVVNPGNVPFIDGKDYEYYVEKAGDFTDNARTGDVMIIKRSNHQWLSPGETKIEEGDYVWVPKEIERSFGYYMNIFSQTAAVITAAVSIALLAIQLRK